MWGCLRMDNHMSNNKNDLISKKNPRLDVEDIKYLGETVTFLHILPSPKGYKTAWCDCYPRGLGLVDHIKDVARRVASEGFSCCSRCLITVSGTPEDADEARSLMQKLDSQATIKNLLLQQSTCNRTVSQQVNGCSGFCWRRHGKSGCCQLSRFKGSGSILWMQPASEDVSKIKASLLIHYAALMNESMQAFQHSSCSKERSGGLQDIPIWGCWTWLF